MTDTKFHDGQYVFDGYSNMGAKCHVYKAKDRTYCGKKLKWPRADHRSGRPCKRCCRAYEKAKTMGDN